MLSIKNGLLTSRRNRPFLRNPERYTIYDMKGVVVHWTANTMEGSNSWANRNYFNSTNRFASAHYIIDAETVLQCLPENEVAFHVGARDYKPIGLNIAEGDRNPNYFLIGVEMCVNEDGDWDTTYRNTVALVQKLLNRHNFTIFQLFRHFDITGKDCPRMMIDEEAWQAFRSDVNVGVNLPVADPVKKATVNVADLNVRTGNGSSYPIVEKLPINEEVNVYDRIGDWFRIGADRWIHSDYVNMKYSNKLATVDVDGTDLNVRSGPGSQYPKVGTLADGASVQVVTTQGSWVKLAGGDRWVHGKYIKYQESKRGYVTTDRLVVRSGPGTNFDKLKRLTKGDIVSILDSDGVWLKVGDGEWTHSGYVEVVT